MKGAKVLKEGGLCFLGGVGAYESCTMLVQGAHIHSNNTERDSLYVWSPAAVQGGLRDYRGAGVEDLKQGCRS